MMQLIGIILLVIGGILFLISLIQGRKKKSRSMEVFDEDFTSLLKQAWLLIKIMAAFLVASGIVIMMFL